MKTIYKALEEGCVVRKLADNSYEFTYKDINDDSSNINLSDTIKKELAAGRAVIVVQSADGSSKTLTKMEELKSLENN